MGDLALPEATRLKGQWNKVFDNNNPIHLELGMGKGQFITTLAIKNANINYLGFEVQEQIIYYGAVKVRELGLANIRLLKENANKIEEFLGPGEAERIYINFCDPWPKKRHARRRLTHRSFLEKYKRLLIPGGLICFKTDNQDLFDFSLQEFQDAGFDMVFTTLDLHGNEGQIDNIETEYEAKFKALGIKICYCEARKEGTM